MSVVNKLVNFVSLNKGDGYYDDDYYEDEDEFLDDEEETTSYVEPVRTVAEDRVQKKPVRTMPARTMRKGGTMVGNNEVCCIRPKSIEDAREITQTLLQERTVVLNLEGLGVDCAQRIIDFTSGSCYAIDGNLQKISQYIFIITPASVSISGDFTDAISIGAGMDVTTI